MSRNTIIPTKYKGELQKHAHSKTIEYILEKLQPGDRFFSERDLAGYLGVSRITAAKITQELVLRGILVRMSKGRTFISKMPNELGINYLLLLPLQHENTALTRDHLIKMKQSCLSGLFSYLQDYDATARIINLNADRSESDLERATSNLTNIDACVIFQHARSELVLDRLLQLPKMDKVATVLMYGTDDRVAYVAPNGSTGVYDAVHYLHSMKHRKIIFYDGIIQYSSYSRARFKGFEEGMKSVKLPLTKNSLIRFDPLRHSDKDPVLNHERFFTNWLDQNPNADFSAIICSGDVSAAGVINALRKQGKRIPQDISVFGFGNLISDRHHEFFELSSIGVSHFDLGQRTGKLLCDYIKFFREASDSPSPIPFQKLLNTELFIRSTTGKAPESNASKSKIN